MRSFKSIVMLIVTAALMSVAGLQSQTPAADR